MRFDDSVTQLGVYYKNYGMSMKKLTAFRVFNKLFPYLPWKFLLGRVFYDSYSNYYNMIAAHRSNNGVK